MRPGSRRAPLHTVPRLARRLAAASTAPLLAAMLCAAALPAAPLPAAASPAAALPAAAPHAAAPLAAALPAAPALGVAAPAAAAHGAAGAAAAGAPLPAPPPSPVALGPALRWRLVGPFRGGRVLAVSGAPGRPETFYFGAVGGGVWRSDDAGRVWQPIFDGPPSGSIGALAVAPSNPDVIYAGSGEADMRSDISYGDGMYRSTDGGRSFQSIGLRDSRQIGRILVDPRDPDVVLVAALGHGFAPNPERGVFRSADGGKSWQRVLYRDDSTGAIDLAASPDEPGTVYAALWNVHRPPWSVYAPLSGPGGGIFRSTDGGLTWTQLTGHGLPAGPFGRIGLAVAAARQGHPASGGSGAGDAGAASNAGSAGAASTAGGAPAPRGPVGSGRRVYALIDDPKAPGLYRSDDGGGSWQRTGTDPRIVSRPWYFGGVTADPHDPETVYVANVSLYRSTDGGRTFQAIKGAPGGDDYHALWIDPAAPRRMILGCDQGAVVSVDGAATWSSWFNQPTAQLYHVATDDGFPYVIYGAQQDSGTVATVSRSDAGSITYRDWFSTGTGESGYILPDPADGDTVYGSNVGGELIRFSRRTSQVQDVSPTPGEAGATGRYRYPWTPALAISPQPPHALYMGSQYVHRSADRGMSWTVISPDLTAPPAAAHRRSAGREAPPQAGSGKAVVYTIAPSPLDAGQIWAGTDDGRIHLTRDQGKSWQEVTPPGLPAWSMVSLIEASRHDAGTAYAAIDRHQMDDLRPYVLRTRDFGRTWTAITSGIPDTAYVHAVREDHERRGLLFAATESGVYVSFDDGGRWQPLQLDLPAASVRDLAVHGDDLIAATHGRSLWVLDGLATLRQLDAAALAAPLHLFTPAAAVRKRRGENRETPLPPETPAGVNPPVGALIDYWLAAAPAGDVTLEIFDDRGELVRRFGSGDAARVPPAAEPYPSFWLRPAPPLAKRAGLNRFVWDLRYPAPPALHPRTSADAVYGQDTPLEPEGPFVLPGTYRLRLTAAGQTASAALRIVADPRLDLPAGALAAQLALVRRIDEAVADSYQAIQQLSDLARAIGQLLGSPTPATAAPRPATSATAPPGPATSATAPPGPAVQATAVAAAAAAPSSGARTRPGSALAAALAALRQKVERLAGREATYGSETEQSSLTTTHLHLADLAILVGLGDAAPTTQAAAAFVAQRAHLDRDLAAYAALRDSDLPAVNRRLAAGGLPGLELPAPPPVR